MVIFMGLQKHKQSSFCGGQSENTMSFFKMMFKMNQTTDYCNQTQNNHTSVQGINYLG